ncbi:DUF6054 family protein [Niameybacter sp.]|uniref:DUF6054 family protein n=1 Tax=Niameybacter sp. TaxID=2033640 RepID=UPI002FCBD1C4
MAQLECKLQGGFHEVLSAIEAGILNGSASASQEGSSDYIYKGMHCAVRVYERYSMIGGNRVSLNITLIGTEDQLFLSAITAGGSQAVLFKINTFGESAFLDCVRDIVEPYRVS